jgi:hypothetical protein
MASLIAQARLRQSAQHLLSTFKCLKTAAFSHAEQLKACPVTVLQHLINSVEPNNSLERSRDG